MFDYDFISFICRKNGYTFYKNSECDYELIKNESGQYFDFKIYVHLEKETYNLLYMDVVGSGEKSDAYIYTIKKRLHNIIRNEKKRSFDYLCLLILFKLDCN